jgi:glucose dehydrogenase
MKFAAALPISAMSDPIAIRDYAQALDGAGFDVLTTAGHLLFGANGGWLSRDREEMEAYFFALDADSGKELWRINLGGTMAANPVTYMAKGKQMVTMAAGGAIFTFSLP